ncbi:tryptophan--tRNA ligase [Thermosulfuriphilus sp.]
MEKKRVLSGMRPTGPLHLGHLHGVLENWKALQEEYECFFFVADWHALTTDYAHSRDIRANSRRLLIDWLSVGIDPTKATIFIQSEIKEHAELHLLFSMITPVSWLERNPTYKDMLQQLKERDLSTYGFLGYPVLQAADILIYKAHRVPVGIDQLPHIELTREIARRFNYLYGTEVFPLPEAILSEVPKVPGTDGRKMSKSFGNAIFLSDPPEVVRQKISQMVTDVDRPRKSDPGDPENRCVAFHLHRLYFGPEEIAEIISACKAAKLGCVQCKQKLAEKVIEGLGPIWERAQRLENEPGLLEEIIQQGRRRAQRFAAQTMAEVRRSIFGP